MKGDLQKEQLDAEKAHELEPAFELKFFGAMEQQQIDETSRQLDDRTCRTSDASGLSACLHHLRTLKVQMDRLYKDLLELQV